MTSSGRGAPVLRVVKGDPTDDELAALVAVLQAHARHRAGAAARRVPGSTTDRGWTDRARLMRSYRRPGPGAWRSSAWADR